LIDLNQLVRQNRAEGKQIKIAFAGDTIEYLAFVLDTNLMPLILRTLEIKTVTMLPEA
jgi:hypothetical protein